MTYAQLEDQANHLAHHLIDQGVQKGRQVGLYCRNRIEIVIAMLGIVKAGAILANVSFRYVEGANFATCSTTPTWSRWCTNAATPTGSPTSPFCHVRTTSVGAARTRTIGATAASSSIPRSRRARRSVTSANAAPTPSICSTPAAPPVSPKGVMWRHEDIYRVLFGGTDFATGEFVKDEYDLAKGGDSPMIRYPVPPMIHGAAVGLDGALLRQTGTGTGIQRRRGVAHDLNTR